jgi:hypothetical protein
MDQHWQDDIRTEYPGQYRIQSNLDVRHFISWCLKSASTVLEPERNFAAESMLTGAWGVCRGPVVTDTDRALVSIQRTKRALIDCKRRVCIIPWDHLSAGLHRGNRVIRSHSDLSSLSSDCDLSSLRSQSQATFALGWVLSVHLGRQ